MIWDGIDFEDVESESQYHICSVCKAMIRAKWRGDTQNIEAHAKWHRSIEPDHSYGLEQTVADAQKRIKELEEKVALLARFKPSTF